MMTHADHVATARQHLEAARALIQDEMRAYPTPVSGCDAQYNHLVGLRRSVADALRILDTPRFVATPRTPDPLAGIESR